MPKKKCPTCKGIGVIKVEPHTTCMFLWGTPIRSCPTCHGTGYVWKKPTVKRMKKIAKIIKENQ